MPSRSNEVEQDFSNLEHVGPTWSDIDCDIRGYQNYPDVPYSAFLDRA